MVEVSNKLPKIAPPDFLAPRDSCFATSPLGNCPLARAVFILSDGTRLLTKGGGLCRTESCKRENGQISLGLSLE